MAEALKLLGQQRPSTAGTAVSLYAVPAATQTVVSSIVVCNTTTTAATFRIFYSTTTVYSVATALFYDVSVAAGATAVLQVGLALNAGNLAVATGTASALTFSAFGQELT